MAKCLVIGGNGFLGSYVVDELVARGHEVTVFDRFSTGSVGYSAQGVRQLVGDFLTSGELRAALDGQDLVFHFLSTTTPATAEDDPLLDVTTNVSKSIELFQLAVDAGVSCIYFASTGGAMYGDVDDDRVSEDAVPAPVSPYAIGKLAIEGYLRYFRRKHGLRSVSFRISNPYGPRQHPNKKQGVIPIFLQRIAGGEAIGLYGDGSMVRDYLFVEDAARMIVNTVGKPAKHPLYNIGSGEGTSLNEIVEIAREVTGREVIVERSEQPATFLDRVVLDTTRYEEEFGASVSVPLREGIARTWRDTLEPRE